MKKIFLVVILLFSIISFAQQSEYNKNVTFSKEQKNDVWLNFNGGEVIIYEQSTVGYFKSFQEIKKILEFYALDFDKPFKDETLLDSNTSLDNYKEMSFDLHLKNAVVTKAWHTETRIIVWICDDKNNGIGISPKKINPQP